ARRRHSRPDRHRAEHPRQSSPVRARRDRRRHRRHHADVRPKRRTAAQRSRRTPGSYVSGTGRPARRQSHRQSHRKGCRSKPGRGRADRTRRRNRQQRPGRMEPDHPPHARTLCARCRRRRRSGAGCLYRCTRRCTRRSTFAPAPTVLQLATERTAMAYATTDDGVRLYYEEAGTGTPIVYVHEFAGDHRSWQPQMAHFARNYRCVTYGARGFPPSDVPAEPERYSQARAVDDIAAILDAIGEEKAFIVGNSMGGFAALHFALTYPERTLGAVVAGCGYGADPQVRPNFQAESEVIAKAFEDEGSASMSKWYGVGPARVQFEAKDPRGHREHVQVLAEHDPVGAANTMRGVQIARPSLY